LPKSAKEGWFPKSQDSHDKTGVSGTLHAYRDRVWGGEMGQSRTQFRLLDELFQMLS
jgi:hypothetical protein